MTNQIKQEGSGNFAFQNIHDSDFNIFIGKSVEYNRLLEQLETQQQLLNLLPEDSTEKRLKVTRKINELKDEIKQFKSDVILLAQAFQNIEINSVRLQQAQDFFDNGEFDKARAILEAEFKEIHNEQIRLLNERDKYENEILPKLKHNSREFHILALATQFDYTNQNRFEDSCRYFELSIESNKESLILLSYAYFLAKHNKHPKANFSSEKKLSPKENEFIHFINTIPHQLSVEEMGKTTYNMAILMANQNDYEWATKNFDNALQFYKNFADENPTEFLGELANLYATRAQFYLKYDKIDEFLQDYEEAIEVHRRIIRETSKISTQFFHLLYSLAAYHFALKKYEKGVEEATEAFRYYMHAGNEISPIFLKPAADTAYLLAMLYSKIDNYEQASYHFEEALKIYRDLTKENPAEFLPEVAKTLHHSAVFYYEHDRYDVASERLEEAFYLRRYFAKDNAAEFLPDVAQTLHSLADLHFKQDKCEKALQEYEEALKIYQNLDESKSNVSLSDIAKIHHSLADLHTVRKDYQKALREYEKALEIRRNLYKWVPDDFASDLVLTLTNLSVLYQTSLPNREKSIEYAKELITILIQIDESVLYREKYMQRAVWILLDWGFTSKEIDLLVTQKIKENEQNNSESS